MGIVLSQKGILQTTSAGGQNVQEFEVSWDYFNFWHIEVHKANHPNYLPLSTDELASLMSGHALVINGKTIVMLAVGIEFTSREN